eukprot:scaffold89542_cov33-Tisochrysis_lutea.AAC.3
MTSCTVRPASSTVSISSHCRAHPSRCVRLATATGTPASAKQTRARFAAGYKYRVAPPASRTPAAPPSIGSNGGPFRNRGRCHSVKSRSNTMSDGRGGARETEPTTIAVSRWWGALLHLYLVRALSERKREGGRKGGKEGERGKRLKLGRRRSVGSR